MTTIDTTQTPLAEGDVIKVREAHDNLRAGEVYVIESVVRADDPENDAGEEFSIINGARILGGTALSSKVERVYTEDQYEQEGYPKWGSAIDQIKDSLCALDDVTYCEVSTSEEHLDPTGHSGVTTLDLYFKRDDGHTVLASVQVQGRVLPLDEMP